MLTFSKTLRIAISALVVALLCTKTGFAGPPTGPNKKNCRDALTATKIQDLNFGEFVANTGGTITIATNGSRTFTGGIILAGGITSAAIFEVNSTLPGCEIYPVTIRTPNTATLTEPVGNSVTLSNFVTLPASGFTIIPGTPTIVEVGADLTIPASQAGGTYDTLAPFTLTFR